MCSSCLCNSLAYFSQDHHLTTKTWVLLADVNEFRLHNHVIRLASQGHFSRDAGVFALHECSMLRRRIMVPAIRVSYSSAAAGAKISSGPQPCLQGASQPLEVTPARLLSCVTAEGRLLAGWGRLRHVRQTCRTCASDHWQ